MAARVSHRRLTLALLLVCALTLPACSAPRAPAPRSEQRPWAGFSDASPAATETPEPTATVFAIIGDYGTDDSHARAVARLVTSWQPAYVIALGDDYYKSAGGSGTGKYDESTGAHYGAWLKDIRTTGRRLPVGPAERNAFFPALGNHDYTDATPSLKTYLTYFRLPGEGFANSSGNERYYDFVQGPVHFFVLNSARQEPDGRRSTSKQARWLRSQLASSTSEWNIVYDHYPPYSSDKTHGSATIMRWPFAEWGADVVLSGHSHTYERIERNGIVYFVNGLGGAKRYSFGAPIKGSRRRYRSNWGAQRATVTSGTLEFSLYTVAGTLVDRYELVKP